MNTEKPPKNFYAVITSEVLFNKTFSCRQKILISMISNMSNEKGYCWASNEYFAEALDTTVRTIQRDILYLESKKIIGRVIETDKSGMISLRALSVIDYVPAATPIPSSTKPKKRTTKEDKDPTFTNSNSQALQQSTEIDLLWLTLKSIYTPVEDKGISNNIAIKKQKKILTNFSKEEQDFIVKLFTKYSDKLVLDNPWLSNFFNARSTVKEVADYFREIKNKKPKAPKAPNDPNKWIGDFSNIEMSQEQIERLEKARQAIKK